MPAYVSTTYVDNGTSVLEPVSQLLKAGISNIELGSVHCQEPELLEKLKPLNASFLTHNFFPADESGLVLNLASSNEDIRTHSIEFMKRAIDFAVKLGATHYTLHPGFLSDPSGSARKSERNFNFDFDNNKNFSPSERKKGLDTFFDSLNLLLEHLSDKPLTLAIETQGSLDEKEVVLFCTPGEFEDFDLHFGTQKTGYNINLAHTYLASKAWGFNFEKTLDQLKPKAVLAEISHTDGTGDQHLDLVAGSWYLDTIQDPVFKKIPTIFESRYISFDRVLESYHLLKAIVG